MSEPLDFKYLAKVLDENRCTPISERHWRTAKSKIASNGKRLAEIEKSTIPSRGDLDRPFTI